MTVTRTAVTASEPQAATQNLNFKISRRVSLAAWQLCHRDVTVTVGPGPGTWTNDDDHDRPLSLAGGWQLRVKFSATSEGPQAERLGGRHGLRDRGRRLGDG